MPDRLVSRLAAELDAVRPRHPRIAQARYRRASRARAPRRRLGGLATAAAVAALALVALATLATGSPNPRVWTGTVAGELQRLQEPSPPAVAPQPTPPLLGLPAPQGTPAEPATSPPKPLEHPVPTDNSRDGHSERPEERPSPSPSGRGGHEPATSDSTPPGR
jgi:hypothetical protein